MNAEIGFAFSRFAKLVEKQFQNMARKELYVAKISKNDLWDMYLQSFPEGTNPLEKTNTHHDCACCRKFIQKAGVLVTLTSSGVETVWDMAADKALYPYNEVATAMRDYVSKFAVKQVFRTQQDKFGSEFTKKKGTARTYEHLYTGNIPGKFRPAKPTKAIGDWSNLRRFYANALDKITLDGADKVLSFIQQRKVGAQHRQLIAALKECIIIYAAITDEVAKNRFTADIPSGGIAYLGKDSTTLGNLLLQISAGADPENELRIYNAHTNEATYMRPTTTTVTVQAVQSAQKTVEDLGISESLQRRFVEIPDIAVEDVLFVDNNIKPQLKGGFEGLLADVAAKPQKVSADKATKLLIDDFVLSVLPTVTSMELLVKPEHMGNFVCLTTAVHSDSPRLFQWDNPFCWSYVGNYTGSIKERVKQAGGRVENNKFRFSLSWNTFCDLDAHAQEPGSSEVYFCNRKSKLRGSDGELDVDMNALSGKTRSPVENIRWTKMPDGPYRLFVNQFCRRENITGFEVELEYGGSINYFKYSGDLRKGDDVEVATFYVRDDEVINLQIGSFMHPTSGLGTERWGIKADTFVRVNAVTHSPNYWGDNHVGALHTFFFLEGCINTDPTRSFYAEYMRNELHEHRRVIEALADRSMCQAIVGKKQMAGLGFQHTKEASFLLKAVIKGKTQLLEITTKGE